MNEAPSPNRRVWRPDPEPIPVPVAFIVAVGCGGWLLALSATLAVPQWHSGERAWWFSSALIGLVLGAIGYVWARWRLR
ncbi:DUF2530 domain-containing protein [Gephyromycinifex aptenodytis]|uniref:DUF2530 domain-containing protein n=1 Tax=Gephyromycinifex aptenodytis TaxID=2716227 RepID=UPI0014461520|nr:DUF2530 domain-containing protein [Gephyromycinifex aptenodytis]